LYLFTSTSVRSRTQRLNCVLRNVLFARHRAERILPVPSLIALIQYVHVSRRRSIINHPPVHFFPKKPQEQHKCESIRLLYYWRKVQVKRSDKHKHKHYFNLYLHRSIVITHQSVVSNMASQTLLRSALSLSLSRRILPRQLRVLSTALKHESESFLTGTSSIYAEQMYENYLLNPESVHESWRRYFDNLQNGVAYAEEDFSQPTAVPPSKASRRQAPQAAVRDYDYSILHNNACNVCFTHVRLLFIL
jgi:2-oxoglutarate dehydrogenase N-terminus